MTAKNAFPTKPIGAQDQVDATRRTEKEMREAADAAIDRQTGRKTSGDK